MRDFLILIILREDECGTLLRCGKFHHDLRVGLNWKLPIVDKTYVEHTRLRLIIKDKELIRFYDGDEYFVKLQIYFRVKSARKALFTVEDLEENLAGLLCAELCSMCEFISFDEWMTNKSKLLAEFVQKLEAPAAEMGLGDLRVIVSTLERKHAATKQEEISEDEMPLQAQRGIIKALQDGAANVVFNLDSEFLKNSENPQNTEIIESLDIRNASESNDFSNKKETRIPRQQSIFKRAFANSTNSTKTNSTEAKKNLTQSTSKTSTKEKILEENPFPDIENANNDSENYVLESQTLSFADKMLVDEKITAKKTIAKSSDSKNENMPEVFARKSDNVAKMTCPNCRKVSDIKEVLHNIDFDIDPASDTLIIDCPNCKTRFRLNS